VSAHASRRSRIEALLARAPIHALRDVVAKRPTSGENIDVLDGIRGLAVLMVLGAHSVAFGLEKHGGVGVWLFFSLSAFLLTMPFARDPERAGRPRVWRGYLGRRVRRVIPAYYTVLLFHVWLAPHSLEWLGRHLTFYQATSVFWTVQQEVLFYAVLPPLLIVNLYIARKRLWLMLPLLAVLMWAAANWLTRDVFAVLGNGRWRPFELAIFLPGVGFSLLYGNDRVTAALRRQPVARLLDLVGLLLLAGLFLTAQFHHERWLGALPPFDGLRSPLGWRHPEAYGLACAAIIYIALVCRDGWLHNLLASPLLRAIGVVSYGLYLVHIDIMHALQARGFGHGLVLFGLTLAASYTVAVVLYGVVERRFLVTRSAG